MMNYSLYLHIPFCRKRCAYCDFNTYAGQEDLIPAYSEALCREMAQIHESAPERLTLHTIFFGGGTPSLLPQPVWEQLFTHIHRYFNVLPDAEISLEANPGTVSPASLRGLRQVGFNRISLGMQSAHPDELRLLGRIHNPLDVIHAVEWARTAGFENLSLDLMFGLPDQTLDRWRANLEFALRLNPEHLSCYNLTIEDDTPFKRWCSRGLFNEPEPDLSADMYELTMDRLSSSGYTQYEISNWAKGLTHACRHNLQYWYNLPYLGVGAGASGYAAGMRIVNVPRIQTYIERTTHPAHLPFPQTSAALEVTPIDRRAEMQETLMVGLRLTETGVSAAGFQSRFGEPLQKVFGSQISKLIGQGLLEVVPQDPDRLRLTRRGRLLGNRVFIEFVGEM